MYLIKCIKNSIPIVFGILFIITCLTLSVLAFLGKLPFKKKSNELGILFMLLFLFGFYFGMLIGNFISGFLDMCISDKSKIILIIPETTKRIHNNDIKKQIQNTKYIDF
jgi:hypothetical protein